MARQPSGLSVYEADSDGQWVLYIISSIQSVINIYNYGKLLIALFQFVYTIMVAVSYLGCSSLYIISYS